MPILTVQEYEELRLKKESEKPVEVKKIVEPKVVKKTTTEEVKFVAEKPVVKRKPKTE